MKLKVTSSVLLRIALCLLLLVAGFAGRNGLKAMKKPPAQAMQQEHALWVRAMRVRPETIPVVISGYGEVTSRSVVTLPAEVAGRITSVHEDLQVGAVIKKDEILYTINEQDYRLAFETAQARLKSLSRDLELARKEFARVSKLYTNNAGSQSSMEKGERAVNAVSGQIIQVEKSLRQAKLHLSRCVIRAPFTGRVTQLNADRDEYVAPGKNLLTLTDDNDLETRVPLDSRDGVNWLRFQPSGQGVSWFGRPEKIPCVITWTENEAVRATGFLDRVVRFDPTTRSLVAAVRLQPATQSVSPLVQGMFCRVDIEGRLLHNVFVLPRQAVSFENTVYVIEDNRLHTRHVEVARIQNNRALITGGLREGDQVIITRLENPPEKALVQIDESMTATTNEGRPEK